MQKHSILLRVIREPLLQFFVLGALLFAVNRYAVGREDNPRRIVIDAERREELASIFQEGQGRRPSPEELQDLIVQWTQNEVLYREARQMRLDEGDDMIRQRLILKMRNVLFSNIVTDAPPVDELRAWFEAHRDRYDAPETFDVEQFRIPEADGETAGKVATELGSDPVSERYRSELRRYERRPRKNLDVLFGEQGTSKLIGTPQGSWVTIQTKQDWHLGRITHRYAAVPAEFEKVRGRVFSEWKDAARKADLSGALKEIVDQYDIRVVAGPEPTPAASLTKLSANARGERRP